jgi:hypothetical protein
VHEGGWLRARAKEYDARAKRYVGGQEIDIEETTSAAKV